MAFFDEILRKSNIGVWKFMPYRESGSKVFNEPTQKGVYHPKNNTGNLGRLSNDNLWRVGTRHELVEHYNKTMWKTARNLLFALAFAWLGIYFYTAGADSGAIEFSLIVIVCGAFVSRHFTSALGGYAGAWSDYENDPVRMIPHSPWIYSNE